YHGSRRVWSWGNFERSQSVFRNGSYQLDSVYNGAVVTSFDKYFKDLSGDQLNLLNDTGFSSSMNSQTIVPKSGTVMVVIFIPSKQFGEGWWTQPCVDRVFIGQRNSEGRVIAPTRRRNLQSGTNKEANSDSTIKEQPGPDEVDRAIQSCADAAGAEATPPTGGKQ